MLSHSWFYAHLSFGVHPYEADCGIVWHSWDTVKCKNFPCHYNCYNILFKLTLGLYILYSSYNYSTYIIYNNTKIMSIYIFYNYVLGRTGFFSFLWPCIDQE